MLDIPNIRVGMTGICEKAKVGHIPRGQWAIMFILNTGTNVAIMCAKALLIKT